LTTGGSGLVRYNLRQSGECRGIECFNRRALALPDLAGTSPVARATIASNGAFTRGRVPLAGCLETADWFRARQRSILKWYGIVQTRRHSACANRHLQAQVESCMYIGGGILGTILLVLLIVWLVRRV
jgi:hypothetical protein